MGFSTYLSFFDATSHCWNLLTIIISFSREQEMFYNLTTVATFFHHFNSAPIMKIYTVFLTNLTLENITVWRFIRKRLLEICTWGSIVLDFLVSIHLPWIIFHHFMRNLFISTHCFIFRNTHGSFSVYTLCLSNKLRHWSRPNVYNYTKIEKVPLLKGN